MNCLPDGDFPLQYLEPLPCNQDPQIIPQIVPVPVAPVSVVPIKEPYSFFPTNPEDWTLWITSITLTILFLVGAYFGARTPFYMNLVKSSDNVWIIAGLWVLVSLISYASFYFVRNVDEKIYGQSRLLPLFIIVAFLNILWVVVFYVYGSFVYTLLILAIVVLLNFFIIIFLWYINIWAALSLVPLEIMYLYLFYSILHLSSINNVTL